MMKQAKPPAYAIPKNLLDALVAYLARQPYGEVAGIIAALQQLKTTRSAGSDPNRG